MMKCTDDAAEEDAAAGDGGSRSVHALLNCVAAPAFWVLTATA